MSSDRQLNYVNNLQNRDQKLYYVDDASELNSINLEENDKIYAINDNKLFQMEIVDQEDELSGSIVSFNGRNNTKIKSLVANIEPVQDLHGYGYPWPAGGGLNKMPVAPVSSNTVNGITYTSDGNGRYTIKGTATASTNVTFNFNEVGRLIAGYKLSLFNSVTGFNLFFRLGGGDQTYWNFSAVNRTATISVSDAKEFDSIRVIVDSGVSIDLSFSPMIYEGDTQTTYSPYSNECPISGHARAEIQQTGKNLWGGLALGQAIVNAVNNQSNTFLGSDSDGNFVVFTAGPVINTKNFTQSVKFKENTAYSFILSLKRGISSSESIATNIVVVYTDGTYSHIHLPTSILGIKQNFVFTSNPDKTISYFELSWYSGTIYMYYNESGIFEGVLSVDDFVPYTGNQISVTFPSEAGDSGTVYGGALTLNPDRTGMLVVDWKKDIVPLNWTFADSYEFNGEMVNKYVRNFTEKRPSPTGVDNGKGILSSIFTPTISDRAGPYHFRGSWNRNIFIDVPASISGTSEDLNAWITKNNVEIAYIISDPQVYQLTAEQISGILIALYGTNNIWSDIGDITVKIVEKGITAFELEPHI